MTYQEYLSSPFSRADITEDEFSRLNAYAEQSIKYAINILIPRWKQQDYDIATKQAVNDAIVQQVIYYKDDGISANTGARKRISESLEGCSATYEYDTRIVNGMNVLNSAIQGLETAFRNGGLMERWI